MGRAAARRIAGLLVATLLPGAALAAPGDLDPSFAGSGFVTTDFAGVFDAATAILVQPDGKLVVAGRTDAGGGGPNFGLARYESDGALDPSFGIDGLVITDAGGSDVPAAIVLQPDGKLVVAGSGGPGASFLLARYEADGSLDPGFGVGGLVTTPIGEADLVEALVVQTDSRLVAAGCTSAGGVCDWALARYAPDGSLDPTFGSGGVVTTDFVGEHDVAHALVPTSGGRLVVAGEASTGGAVEFALVRYDADGSLDPGFGSGGMVTTDLPGGDDRVRALVLQPDGRLVVAGSVETEVSSRFALARYEADGSLDASFGSGGIATTELPGQADAAYALVQLPNGKLVAAGQASGDGGFTDIALLRYDAAGVLDPGFGDGGVVTTALEMNRPDSASALVLQPDQKLVVAGTHSSTVTTDFAVVRYRGGEAAPGLGPQGSLMLVGALTCAALAMARVRRGPGGR